MSPNAFYFRLCFNIEEGQIKQMVNREAVTPPSVWRDRKHNRNRLLMQIRQ
ncbi:hypothetical protein NEIPOLOT_01514 [Neisseria polysaccharea ATCC 43768]|nr:hypothetical protein NEIPOLOT_01514 [Neisseria polysaccharea ATCC 43768]